jgi:hypothetical protein
MGGPTTVDTVSGVSTRALRDFNARRLWPGLRVDGQSDLLDEADDSEDEAPPDLLVPASGVAPATEPLGAVTCRYSAWSRHALRGRDRTMRRLADAIAHDTDAAMRTFAQAQEDLREWTAVWATRVRTLLQAASAAPEPTPAAESSPAPVEVPEPPPATSRSTSGASATGKPRPR